MGRRLQGTGLPHLWAPTWLCHPECRNMMALKNLVGEKGAACGWERLARTGREINGME